MKKVLLGVMLAVFLVGLMGMPAQAEVPMETKEVQIGGYSGALVTVKYPDFKEIKEFSVERDRIYITIYFNSFRNFSKFYVEHGDLVFSIQYFGKRERNEIFKNRILNLTKVAFDEGEIKIEGYIKIVPTNLEETITLVDAMRGDCPLHLRIWYKIYKPEFRYVIEPIDLD